MHEEENKRREKMSALHNKLKLNRIDGRQQLEIPDPDIFHLLHYIQYVILNLFIIQIVYEIEEENRCLSKYLPHRIKSFTKVVNYN